MKNFEELGVSTSILQAIDELGYVSPTPVQEKVIPYLLGEGYDDVVALANLSNESGTFLNSISH